MRDTDVFLACVIPALLTQWEMNILLQISMRYLKGTCYHVWPIRDMATPFQQPSTGQISTPPQERNAGEPVKQAGGRHRKKMGGARPGPTTPIRLAGPAETFYLQVKGTAMGSHVAPPYANAYMIDFEESIIYKNPLFQANVILWKRYIDDVFCIWHGPTETLHSFFETLNVSWPGISFTISNSPERMNFLDTLVIKNPEGLLGTDLYSKSTDRNSLLHFESLHPPSTKKSIPRAQYQRVQQIVSNMSVRESRIREMTHKFEARGYPSPF
ncbi:unnamed protein product [Ranitomeya imitator]|uniref:Helix-turn-helix domain-containing protein n=1 Tax=Ranitomeya imitator TaxID=111125 RepID=A0ABN9KZD8_9NEOB|nr:unnamed protein product [Ranitomeya imitator]